MATSALRSQGRLQEQAGNLGRARVKWVPNQGLVHKVTCTICDGHGGRTYRQGRPNGFADALERWTLHLHHVHPEVDAPCLSRLAEIKAARKEQREGDRRRLAEIEAASSSRSQGRKAELVALFEAASIAENIVRA